VRHGGADVVGDHQADGEDFGSSGHNLPLT
jgi:hypothetical protein